MKSGWLYFVMTQQTATTWQNLRQWLLGEERKPRGNLALNNLALYWLFWFHRSEKIMWQSSSFRDINPSCPADPFLKAPPLNLHHNNNQVRVLKERNYIQTIKGENGWCTRWFQKAYGKHKLKKFISVQKIDMFQ